MNLYENLINPVYKNLKKFLSAYFFKIFKNYFIIFIKFPISESLLRFLMSRYVSLNQERGFVNYEELVKFLARCLSNSSAGQQQQQQQNKPVQQRFSLMLNIYFKNKYFLIL